MPYVNVNVDTEAYFEYDDLDTEDMIEYLEKGGYVVVEKGESMNEYVYIGEVDKLYSTWLTCDGKIFEKELRDFFSRILNKNV